jgi:protoporphyrinogen oxidase
MEALQVNGPKITIVGGGLAGMVAAWRLQERGCQVTLFEASGRWGGKAGATQQKGTFEEHGYHIFPAWYRNAWRMVDELNIRADFVDCTEFKQLRPNAYPTFHSFTNITSARYIWKNLTAGVLSFSETFLFFYAALDLMSRPYRHRAKLDQVTVTGFLRSRFYRTEQIAQQFQELMLKGISVPTYEVSAMTMRNVMRFWAKAPEPMHRILNGDLQSKWIEPIRKKLVDLGVSLHLGRKLVGMDVGQGRVEQIRLADKNGRIEPHSTDYLLLAVPVEKLTPFVQDKLYAGAPALGELRHVRTRAMTAFNVYFRRKIPDMPAAHVNLLDSRYGISFIDVSQIWETGVGTVLNLIASDVVDLQDVSPELAISALMDDLRRYLPFEREDVQRIVFQSHADQPLFMNDVGGWAFRPKARTQLNNLYLAGDFCQTPIDLVSMEGAITSALMAAESIRNDLGLATPVEILQPPVYPRWLLVAGQLTLLPAAAIAKLWTLVSGSKPDPEQSDVPPFDPATLPNWPLEVIDESAFPIDPEQARGRSAGMNMQL